jgi:hypothetical protein
MILVLGWCNNLGSGSWLLAAGLWLASGCWSPVISLLFRRDTGYSILDAGLKKVRGLRYTALGTWIGPFLTMSCLIPTPEL